MAEENWRRTGVQGWRQFLASKSEVLNAYDQARVQAKAHETEVFHGRAVEAAFRRWLEEFLPKRYGVTSGYIVSHGLNEATKLPHFDVIIFDQLESPVLWVERSIDNTASGMSRAIPAENVRAIIEIKSAFSTQTAATAIRHLHDVDDLLAPTSQQTPVSVLPSSFFSATVFIELRKQDEYAESALGLIATDAPKRYYGGIILRGEGRPVEESARIMVLSSTTAMPSTIGRQKASLLAGMSVSGSQVKDGAYVNACLSWTGASFSMFAFDIVALLAGRYRPGYVSSFHGMTYLTTQPIDGA